MTDIEYDQYSKLLRHAARAVRSRSDHTNPHMSMDDIMQDAYIYMCNAIDTYQEGKSSLPTWIRNKVYWGLLEQQQTESRHARLLPIDRAANLDTVPKDSSRYRNFLLEISSDAKAVVELVTGIHWDCTKKPHQSQLQRLTDFLLGAGWQPRRILKVFQEIREAIG